MLAGRSWTGLDISGAELAAARSTGAQPLLRARASAIPLRDASVDAVTCSVSLMAATPAPLASHGPRVAADSQSRLGYRLRGPADAGRLLLSSLYLPGIPAVRCRIGLGYLRFLVLFRCEIPVPLRRVTAERAGG